MKQFRLISSVLLFILIVICFVNIFFYRISVNEAELRRAERIENLSTVYAEEFRSMGLLARHMSNNKLVDDLRYERALNSDVSKKYQSLVNALSLIEASYSETVRPYVYFHNSEAIVSSDGKMDPDLLGREMILDGAVDFQQLRGDRSKEIQIIPRIGVYYSTTYANREQSDWATLYIYTQEDVSVIVASRNAPLSAMLSVAAQDAANLYAVWDSLSMRVILSNSEALLGAPLDTSDGGSETASEGVLKALLAQRPEAIVSQRSRGRFTCFLAEEKAMESLVSMRINVLLWATVTFGLLFALLYYLMLNREVFRPLSSILKKLQFSSRPRNEYDAIEDAIFHMQSRIDNLSQSLDDASAQEKESRMRQALLGAEGQNIQPVPEGADCFALISLIGESDADVQRVDEWIRCRFAGRLIADMQGQRLYLLWFDGEAGYLHFLRGEGMPVDPVRRESVALGISRAYRDPAEIRRAYQESSDVIHARVEGDAPFMIYAAGRDETDHSVGVLMGARDSGMLLSTIAGGDVEAATQFVSEILDGESNLTIAQNRYRATYMVNVMSMAQNTHQANAVDLTVWSARIRGMVSEQSMREAVLDTCEAITRTFSSAKEDALIRSIRAYVEEHYTENIYLKTIAEETGFSYAYVSHYFSERQGIGFADYLNSVRVEKAREMLTDPKVPLDEIARRVGFGSMNTFVRNMRKFTGMTPDAYRRQHRGV